MNGYLNIFKPTGLTSSNVVSRVRYNLQTKKVGHAGTLDPSAAGVLPIMVGRACKMFDYLNLETKQYICEFTFGHHTNTLDQEGDILDSCDIVPSIQDIVDAIASHFIGDISQVPPKVSAISIGGRRAYTMARSGEDFEIPARNVSINSFDLVRQTSNSSFIFSINCSKGTYIRSLCRDLAAHFGTCAYVSFLLRSTSGYFDMSDSITLEELEEYAKKGTIDEYITPVDEPLSYLRVVEIPSEHYKLLTNGNPIKIHNTGDIDLCRVYCMDIFIGIGSASNDIIKVHKRFN